MIASFREGVSSRLLALATTSHTLATSSSSVRALSRGEQRAFFALSNVHASFGPFVGIVKTNAIPLGHNASSGGLFLTCSRFNHSCNANAAYSWDERNDLENIIALKDIDVGDEITVNYVPESIWLLPRESRYTKIQQQYGFTYAYSIYQADPEIVTKSDTHNGAEKIK